MASAAPQLTIVIATRNRWSSLARALDSLDRSLTRSSANVETIVVDNGSTDETPEFLARWQAEPNSERVVLHVREQGKARALNVGWRAARATTVAFTDDDVIVPEAWVSQVLRFARERTNFAAATGRVTLPPEARSPDVVQRVRLFRTLPLFDRGPNECESKHLYGCNMVVRRDALDTVGGFDPRLGPGASGLHEDGDLARRLRAAGYTLLYLPDLEMHHAVDPERFTWAYFCQLHRADARSRWIRDGNRGLPYALQHWMGGVLVWLFWTLARNRPRQMRARGRLMSHTEYLRLWWRAVRSPSAPSS